MKRRNACPMPPRTDRKTSNNQESLRHAAARKQRRRRSGKNAGLRGHVLLCLAARSAFQSVRWDSIVSHEDVQLVARNPAESASRYAKTRQRTVVEAPDDRLLANVTNPSRFAGREYSLPRFCRWLKPKQVSAVRTGGVPRRHRWLDADGAPAELTPVRPTFRRSGRWFHCWVNPTTGRMLDTALIDGNQRRASVDYPAGRLLKQ